MRPGACDDIITNKGLGTATETAGTTTRDWAGFGREKKRSNQFRFYFFLSRKRFNPATFTTRSISRPSSQSSVLVEKNAVPWAEDYHGIFLRL